MDGATRCRKVAPYPAKPNREGLPCLDLISTATNKLKKLVFEQIDITIISALLIYMQNNY